MKRYIIDFIGGRLDITDANEESYNESKYYAYADYFGMTSDSLDRLQQFLNANYSYLLGISNAYDYFGEGE